MRRYIVPPDVACATVEDGAVLLHMGTKLYYSLNETGAEIWKLIEDDVPLGDIPTALTERFDVSLAEAQAAVAELVEVLAAKTLLIIEDT